MAEKVNLVEFDIDVDVLLKNTQDVKQRLDEVKQEMRDMTKAGKSSSEAFVNNAVSARALSREYTAQIKALDQLNNESSETIPIQQRIDAALNKEAITIKDLRDQTSELTKIRNDVNLTTVEGEEQLNMLNAAIDRNNGLVKNNVSEMEQQRMSVGGYTDAILDAFGTTNMFNGTLGDMQGALKALTPVYESIKTELTSVGESLKNVTAGTEGMTVAQKASAVAANIFSGSLKLLRVALISTGIGAIVVALGSLVAYLSSSEEASNRFSKILKTIGGVVRGLIRQLEPLGELLFDGIEAGFNAIGKAADAALKLVGNALDSLGFDNAAKSVRNFHQEMGEAADMARILAQREEEYTVSQRNANRIMLDYQRQAERLRQIRDDESLSIAERNQANEDLGKVLQEQLATEKQIAIQALEIANIRISADGATAANLDAQAEAMERISDIQERVEGQLSEQLTNRNSLQRDSAALAKEAADAAQQRAADEASRMEDEISLLEAQQGFRAKTLEESLQFEQQIADRRQAILEHELANKLISQTEYNTAVLELQNELAEQQANATVQAAQRELDNVSDRLAVEAEISNAVGEERLRLEAEQAKQLYDARENFEAIQFLEGLTNKQEYEDNLAEIARERNSREREIEQERLEADRVNKAEQRELDLETELAGLEERQAAIWEFEEVQLEAQRERDLEQARLKYADEAMLQQAIANIEQQYQNNRTQLEIEKNKTVFESRLSLLDSLASIFGEQSAIGKAAGIAQATVNAYVGMTEALKLPWPLNLAAAASTLATGLKSVRTISAVDTSIKTPQTKSMRNVASTDSVVATINDIPPFAGGGIVTGGFPISRSNGDNVLATLKKGEVVLNDEHQMRLGGPSIFRAIGVPGFANGGVAGGSTATLQRSIITGLDETMAKSIGDAVLKGSRQGTQTGSRQGIVDASTERYLDNLATF